MKIMNSHHSRSFSTIALLFLLTSSVMVASQAAAATYKAVIKEIRGTDSNVTGTVVVFTDKTMTKLGYAGILTGLNASLDGSTCSAAASNGCGVHIHEGFSCDDNATLQGGHYYVNTTTVTADPWVDVSYSSDNTGKANFAGLVNIGTNNVDGRAFIGT